MTVREPIEIPESEEISYRTYPPERVPIVEPEIAPYRPTPRPEPESLVRPSYGRPMEAETPISPKPGVPVWVWVVMGYLFLVR